MELVRLIAAQLRIRQWSKNLLVLGAPLAAGVLDDWAYLWPALLAFLAFGLVASGLYVINDLADREADRLHPEKSRRPIASGKLRITTARILAAGTLTLGFLLSALISWTFLVVTVIYAFNVAAYSLYGKKVPTLEMLQVGLGFVLRPVGGAVATGIVMSPWFLGVAMFGSLLLVAGKRSSEKARMGDGLAVTRPVLDVYTAGYLRQVSAIAAGGVLLTYALWALAEEGTMASPWAALSFGPVLFAVLRYVQLTDSGATETPEVTMLRDPGVLAAGALWLVFAVAGLYLA